MHLLHILKISDWLLISLFIKLQIFSTPKYSHTQYIPTISPAVTILNFCVNVKLLQVRDCYEYIGFLRHFVC